MANFFSIHPELDIMTCLAHAARTTHQYVFPLSPDTQGSKSFTCATADGLSLVQFRANSSPIIGVDVELARQIYAPLAPITEYSGPMPASNQCKVWVMDKLPGAPFPQFLRVHRENGLDLRVNMDTVVSDMAKFFAMSWARRRQPGGAEISRLYEEIRAKVNAMFPVLPTRLRASVFYILSKLRDILSGLPWVLTHKDLTADKTLWNSMTGNLTGVIHWSGSRYLPFGLGLCGLVNVTGSMDNDQWTWLNDDPDFPRRSFREVFLQHAGLIDDDMIYLIEHARKLGLLLGWANVHKEGNITEQDIANLDRILQGCSPIIPPPDRDPEARGPDVDDMYDLTQEEIDGETIDLDGEEFQNGNDTQGGRNGVEIHAAAGDEEEEEGEEEEEEYELEEGEIRE